MYTFLTILFVVLGSIVVASFLEGLFHQFILHTAQKRLFGGALTVAYEEHAVKHHPAFRGEHYHRSAPEGERRVSLGPWMLPSVLLFTSPLTVGLWLAFGPVAAWACVGTLTLYYASYEFLHWHMHFTRPDGRPRWYHAWPPSRQLFAWFDRRHYIHHDADDRNFNVVLPIYDVLFGRYSTREDSPPWAVRRRHARAMRRSAALRELARKKT